MKIIRELLALQEETLQQIVKRLLKQDGTLTDVLGSDAPEAAKLLQANANDDALVIRPDNQMSMKMIRSVAAGRAFDSSTGEEHGKLRVMRMPGGARLLVVGEGEDAFIVTTAHMRDQLVESA